MIAFVIIVLLVAYFAKSIISDFMSAPAQINHEPPAQTNYTPKTLAKFNGKDDPKVYLAVKGKVFDVTAGKSFYGPGGPYENFAGRDASRGLAYNSFDVSVLTPLDQPLDTLTDLSAEERESLDNWETHFEGKYTLVGTLSNEKA